MDPTAFTRAGAIVPASGLANSAIQAHQAGLQTGAARSELVTSATDLARKQGLIAQAEDLSKQAFNASASGDMTGYASAIKELAIIDPGTASELDKVINGTGRTKRVEAAYRLLAAYSIGEENADLQNKMLSEAQEIVGPTDIYYDAIGNIKSLTGKDRVRALIEAVEMSKRFGYFPNDPTVSGGKTPDQIEREILVKEKGVDLRATEAQELAKQREFERGRLPQQAEKRYDDLTSASDEAQGKANQIDAIRKSMMKDPGKVGGGLYKRFVEMTKKAFGEGDETTALRLMVDSLRVKEGLVNLPPGPATDKDLKIALSVVPDAYTNPTVVESWLRGLQKAHIVNSVYAKRKAKFMESNRYGSLLGFTEDWERNGTALINQELSKYNLELIPDNSKATPTPLVQSAQASRLPNHRTMPTSMKISVSDTGEIQ